MHESCAKFTFASLQMSGNDVLVMLNLIHKLYFVRTDFFWERVFYFLLCFFVCFVNFFFFLGGGFICLF